MMNDNEIIETFENNCNSCENCPYHIYSDCDDRNRKDILALIKRQQEEIERLDKCREINVSSIATLYQKLKTARTEAVKEFANKLREKHVKIIDREGRLHYVYECYEVAALEKETIEKGK